MKVEQLGMVDVALLDDLRAAGGDVEELTTLARTSRAELSDALKALGYVKMGSQKASQLTADRLPHCPHLPINGDSDRGPGSLQLPPLAS